MGTIALVTLVRSGKDSAIPAGELIEQIRAAIESSGISKNWTIEKVSILGDAELAAPGIPPEPSKKNVSYGD